MSAFESAEREAAAAVTVEGPGRSTEDTIMPRHPSLSDEERSIYQWQLWVAGFGEDKQELLKGSSVLISRCGGVGGAAALELAAAGVGRLVLAHAGDVGPSDLNRQVLMTHDWIGKPRLQSAARRLKELNPRLVVETVFENVSEANAHRLVASVDLVMDCAPRFNERLWLNRAAVALSRPLVECAMFELELQLTTVLPGRTPCLACLYPVEPPAWRREFPVFGAVAGTVGCLGAMEAIKVLTGLGEPLAGAMLIGNLRDMTFQRVSLQRRPDCPVCGAKAGEAGRKPG
jgi:molybdopterin/thiamine biosynthesis adenylyltransferase